LFDDDLALYVVSGLLSFTIMDSNWTGIAWHPALPACGTSFRNSNQAYPVIWKALRIPMKSSMNSGHVVHLSERSDDGMIIVHQVVGMARIMQAQACIK
jgi:hypothetical protein